MRMAKAEMPAPTTPGVVLQYAAPKRAAVARRTPVERTERIAAAR